MVFFFCAKEVVVNILTIDGLLHNCEMFHSLSKEFVTFNHTSSLFVKQIKWVKVPYPKLVSSLNNPQNSEMKFCVNMKLTC